MTRLQRTLLLAGVIGLGGLAAAAYLALRAPTSAERLEAKVKRERLFAFGRSDVARVVIRRGDEQIVLTRAPGTQWELERPVRWPADLRAMEALLDRTAALRAKRTVFEAPSPQNLSDTGLASPAVELEVTTDGETHRLALGSTNPVTELMHARADDGPIVLVQPDFRWALDRPAEDFRMDRLFPFRTEDVARVRSKAPSGATFRLERASADDRYDVVTPDERFRAGVGVTAVFLAAVTKRLEVEDYLSDEHPYPELPEDIASVQPGSEFVLDVRHQTGITRSATLALAKLAVLDEPVPIAWVGSSVVQLYPPPVEEVITTTASELRDRSLAWFNPSDVRRLRVFYAGATEPWVFERADDRQWVRTAPAAAEGVGVVLREVLYALARLKGDRTAAEDPSPQQLRTWFIEPPSRRFVVEDASGQVLADVRLGNWASEDALYVRGAGSRVDVVPIDRLSKVPVDLEELVTSER